jgi:type IV pilus assembly protein PilX
MSTRFRGRVHILHRKQRGAALFVAMMILILLSLLAVSASQVTALQEKMVQAYWADVRAFDGGEERLRRVEKDLRAQAILEECPVVEDTELPAWAYPYVRLTAAGDHRKNLSEDRGSGVGGSIGNVERGSVECQYFLLTTVESDSRDDMNANSWAAVQSLFVP